MKTFVVLLHESEQALVAQHELLLRLTRLQAALCHQGDHLHVVVRSPWHSEKVSCRFECGDYHRALVFTCHGLHIHGSIFCMKLIVVRLGVC